MVASGRRILLLGTIAVAALVAWCWIPATLLSSAQDLSVPVVVDDETVLADGERWRRHLMDGGTIRLRPSESELSRNSDTSVRGMGKLVGAVEMEYARESVRSVLDLRARALEVAIRRSEGGASADPVLQAEIALAIAEAALKHDMAVAFMRALDQGEYYLVESGAPEIPLPQGWSRLNFGLERDKVAMLCCIIVRESDYGIDGMRVEVSRKKRDLLQAVADKFNGQPDEVRRAEVVRYLAGRQEDSDWRKATFPEGLRVDSARSTVSVQ